MPDLYQRLDRTPAVKPGCERLPAKRLRRRARLVSVGYMLRLLATVANNNNRNNLRTSNGARPMRTCN